jgi:hypothetical protein
VAREDAEPAGVEAAEDQQDLAPVQGEVTGFVLAVDAAEPWIGQKRGSPSVKPKGRRLVVGTRFPIPEKRA